MFVGQIVTCTTRGTPNVPSGTTKDDVLVAAAADAGADAEASALVRSDSSCGGDGVNEGHAHGGDGADEEEHAMHWAQMNGIGNTRGGAMNVVAMWVGACRWGLGVTIALSFRRRK